MARTLTRPTNPAPPNANQTHPRRVLPIDLGSEGAVREGFTTVVERSVCTASTVPYLSLGAAGNPTGGEAALTGRESPVCERVVGAAGELVHGGKRLTALLQEGWAWTGRE